MQIAGCTALVTGGAHRVGKAITVALAQAGANVVINYNSSSDKAEATTKEAEQHGIEAVAIQADISDPDQVAAMVAQAEQRFGGVDVLVNSASQFAIEPFPTDDFEIWHRTFDVVVHGAYYCSARVAPGMLERERGLIVNIADLSAWQPFRIEEPTAWRRPRAWPSPDSSQWSWPRVSGQRHCPRANHPAYAFRRHSGGTASEPHARWPLGRWRGGRQGCVLPRRGRGRHRRVPNSRRWRTVRPRTRSI